MTSRRVLKAAEAIREVVSTAILMEIKDPRIQDVTVTYVEVSPDMRNAKVHVSVMGNDAKQKLSLHGLQSAAGFLQSKIAQRIDTRYTPRLQFLLDQGVKHSIEVSRILSDLFPAKPVLAETADQDSDEQDSDDQDSDELDSDELDSDELDSDELDSDELDSDELDSDELDSDDQDSDDQDETMADGEDASEVDADESK